MTVIKFAVVIIFSAYAGNLIGSAQFEEPGRQFDNCWRSSPVISSKI